MLPPLDDMNELYTLPVFLVPSMTQEPIDLRFVSDSDACIALNQQRHKDTVIRYTTAASNPMQIKIELLSALSKGKPLLVVLMSTDKRFSAIGRNACQAIEMLEPDQKARIKVFTHGWGFNEASIVMEAIKAAQACVGIYSAIYKIIFSYIYHCLCAALRREQLLMRPMKHARKLLIATSAFATL